MGGDDTSEGTSVLAISDGVAEADASTTAAGSVGLATPEQPAAKTTKQPRKIFFIVSKLKISPLPDQSLLRIDPVSH